MEPATHRSPDSVESEQPVGGPRESVVPPPGRGDVGPRRRRGRLLLAGAVVLVCLGLVFPLVAGRFAGGQRPPAPAPASTPVASPGPLHPVKQVPPVGGPTGVSWKLQFDEGFADDKAAVLNSGIWHSGWFGDGELTGTVNSLETALFSRDNLSVADGIARFEVTPNTRHQGLAGGTSEPNLGAALNTDEAQASRGFMMTYGYVEARMQLPAAPVNEKVWPSFWLNGETWPRDMEIDVVEGDGTDQGNKFNIHYGTGHTDTTNLNNEDRLRTVPGATTGMHTYGAEIRPDGVTFYYDGLAVYSFQGKVPNVPRYLMVGVSSSAKVSSPKALLVDYVRAWTRAGQ
jgi:hypothetical protein